MKTDRRLTMAAAVALGSALVAPVATLAATGPVPEGGASVVVPGGPDLPGFVWVGLGAVVIGIVASSRPTWRRPMAAILVFLGGAFAALMTVVAGLLSSWNDAGSNIPLPFLVAAIAFLGIGLGVSVKILLDGRRARTVDSQDPVA
jgi:hypothetical protein